MLEQLDKLRHELELARLDLNAKFLPNIIANRRKSKIKPATERRK